MKLHMKEKSWKQYFGSSVLNELVSTKGQDDVKRLTVHQSV